MKTTEPIYKELTLNSRNLIVPREAYQRELNPARVRKIAAEVDEHIANEPKVSCRNGRYYVFDGQHTIAARVERNGGKPLMILCKVYYGKRSFLSLAGTLTHIHKIVCDIFTDLYCRHRSVS